LDALLSFALLANREIINVGIMELERATDLSGQKFFFRGSHLSYRPGVQPALRSALDDEEEEEEAAEEEEADLKRGVGRALD